MGKKYKVFISHSWKYSDAYEKLKKWLDDEPRFEYLNHSVPKDDPIHTNGTDKELYNAIQNKISNCHCVIILAGVYSSYSKWIDKEIQIAKIVYGKPIIAIQPWGSERTSKLVKDNADRIIGWNKNSLISAIKELS